MLFDRLGDQVELFRARREIELSAIFVLDAKDVALTRGLDSEVR